MGTLDPFLCHLRRMKKAVAICLVGGLAVGGLAIARRNLAPLPPTPVPGATARAGTTTYSIVVGGVNRTYNLHVPPSAAATHAPMPLLIELHGGGGNASGMEKLTGFFGIADREGFVVAAPNALGRSWVDGRVALDTAANTDDIAFLSAMIDQIATQAAIDPTRIYATGMSNGAMMTGRLACQLSDRIAAFAQVSGTAAVETAQTCRPGRAVPVLEIHGTADPLVPYEGGTVLARLQDGRGKVVGVDDWASFWAANNQASLRPGITTQGTDTTIRIWQGESPASDVVFYRVEGAGHTWPGGSQYLPKIVIGSTTATFDASQVIWEFLSAHHLGG
jgi:polyhydroxybutyrate depolymerase